MTSERTQAYGRIVKTLEELGPVKLLASEPDDHVIAALDDVRALADHLVESGRWTEERALLLVDDVAGTGPLAPVA
jgi:hypothetical protein